VFKPVAPRSSLLTASADRRRQPAAGIPDPAALFLFQPARAGKRAGLARSARSEIQRQPDAEFPIVLVPPKSAAPENPGGGVLRGVLWRQHPAKGGLGRGSDPVPVRGTRALVGSTKISYGAAAAPLIAADLLGRLFLQNCQSGIPAGESLRLAKLAFADEMNRRQGFLDPEDQKTLASFIPSRRSALRLRSRSGETGAARGKALAQASAAN